MKKFDRYKPALPAAVAASGTFRRLWITRRLAVGFGSKQSTDPRLWRAMWGVQVEWWASRDMSV